MQDQVHVYELLPAYALHCLDAEEASRVAEHLASCAECRAELLAYQTVAGRLALGAPDTAPPAHLKNRLLAQVQAPQAAPARAPVRTRRQRAAMAWGLAALVLLVALVAGASTVIPESALLTTNAIAAESPSEYFGLLRLSW